MLLFLDFTAQLQRLLDDELKHCKAADDLARAEAAKHGRQLTAAEATVTVANMQVSSEVCGWGLAG